MIKTIRYRCLDCGNEYAYTIDVGIGHYRTRQYCEACVKERKRRQHKEFKERERARKKAEEAGEAFEPARKYERHPQPPSPFAEPVKTAAEPKPGLVTKYARELIALSEARRRDLVARQVDALNHASQREVKVEIVTSGSKVYERRGTCAAGPVHTHTIF